MRERRHNGWVAGWALGCLLVLAFTATSPVRAEATPTPTAAPLATATPTATPTPAPTATPAPTSTPTATPTSTPAPTPTSTAAPTATPTPAPQAACQPWATPYPHDHIVRGEWVDVAFHDFDPGGAVTLLLIHPNVVDTTPIGAGHARSDGNGVVRGLVPPSTAIGDAQLQVLSDLCTAYTSMLVLGSAERMTVDDTTVSPGQLVTIRAGGFLPDTSVGITIDRAPVQGECYPYPCRQIGGGPTDDVGAAMIEVRIPTDVDAGVHHLYASGYSPDSSISDLTVGVEIRVAGATGTLPPTDTAS